MKLHQLLEISSLLTYCWYLKDELSLIRLCLLENIVVIGFPSIVSSVNRWQQLVEHYSSDKIYSRGMLAYRSNKLLKNYVMNLIEIVL